MSLKHLLLGSALTTFVYAQPLVVQQFNYPDLLDQALISTVVPAGTYTSTNVNYVTAGLSYVGMPAALGGAIQFNPSDTLVGPSPTPWVGAGTPTAVETGTYWYSFLFRPEAGIRGTVNVMFSTGSANGQDGVGIRVDNNTGNATGTTVQIKALGALNGGFGTAVSLTNGYGVTYLILGKIVVDTVAGTGSNTVWVNPSLTAEPTTGGVSTTLGSTFIPTLRKSFAGRAFGTGTGGTAQTLFLVDEIRVGTTFSDVTTEIVAGLPPTVTTQPSAASYYVGQNAGLSVGVSGTPPFTYEWRKVTGADPLVDFSVVAGATTNSLSFSPAQTTDSATYYCRITNSTDSVNSSTAALTVVAPVAASITTQPTDATVNAGATATLSVVAAGAPAPTYQWQKLTAQDTFTNVVGATSATLNITNTDFLAEGDYRCVVSYSVPGVAGSSSTTNSDTVTVTALIDPSEGDTDNDGMADSLEKYLSNLGFAVGVSNTAKVQSLINSGYPVSFTGTPPASEVNELALTATTVTRLSDGRLELSFGLKEAASPSSTFTTKALTTDDVSVTNGKIILSVGDGFGGETDFYRLSTETK
jgi:hypothetical protein